MEFNKGYATATHQPLISGVLDLYNPQFVLELGIGKYSSPLFLNSGVQYMGIENNVDWISFMEGQINAVGAFIHHDIGIPCNYTIRDVNQAQIHSFESFYDNLVLPDTRQRLLFVDNYASCRILAINSFLKRDAFDIIIFHDAEERAVKWFGYEQIIENNMTKYYLTSDEAWTALMVKEDMGYDALHDAVSPYITIFEREYGNINMNLIKDDGHI